MDLENPVSAKPASSGSTPLPPPAPALVPLPLSALPTAVPSSTALPTAQAGIPQPHPQSTPNQQQPPHPQSHPHSSRSQFDEEEIRRQAYRADQKKGYRPGYQPGGFPHPSHGQSGHHSKGHTPQGHSQGHPPSHPGSAQGHPGQGHPGQAHAHSGSGQKLVYPSQQPHGQHMAGSGHPLQHPSHPQQGHPQQGHPQQGHAQQGQGHPQQGHPMQGQPGPHTMQGIQQSQSHPHSQPLHMQQQHPQMQPHAKSQPMKPNRPLSKPPSHSPHSSIHSAHPSSHSAHPSQSQQGPQGQQQQQQGQSGPPTMKSGINVKDALDYLDEVKSQFSDRSEVYNKFLDIMKDFNIDTPDVIERVSSLFRGHPRLINGYFITAGEDRVEVDVPLGHPPIVIHLGGEEKGMQGVVTGQQQAAQVQQSGPAQGQQQQGHPQQGHPQQGQGQQQQGGQQGGQQGQASESAKPEPKRTIEFNQAINYVNKIKNRFSSEPETYKKFLEILQLYQKDGRHVQDVYQHINVLFKNSPDLLDEFKQFLPDTSASPAAGERGEKRVSLMGLSNGLGKEKEKRGKREAKEKRVKIKGGQIDELEFFDKVKRTINSKSTYNEFLKILNLFSQEIIDNRTLIERVTPFLGEGELLVWFKRFVKYEDGASIREGVMEGGVWNKVTEKEKVDLAGCKGSGRSYRLLPAGYDKGVCSSRDALCNEVLNNDWISHPIYLSETGFTSHKKNPHEEAMYKCEEERYEFDRHISLNLQSVGILEGVAKRMEGMGEEERRGYRVVVGGGMERAVGRVWADRAGEVVEALKRFPTVAVPVVLRRMKQKDEEWKKLQREHNKVWRDIEYKNFHKSLDHQCLMHKSTDRKQTTSKSLVTEIETLLKNQTDAGTALSFQLEFSFKYSSLPFLLNLSDQEVWKDVWGLLDDSADLLVKDDLAAVKELFRGFLGRVFGVAGGMYVNTGMYVLTRLVQILYSRLASAKRVCARRDAGPGESVNPLAYELGLRKPDLEESGDTYILLLEKIRGVIRGGDTALFEDWVRERCGGGLWVVYGVSGVVLGIVKAGINVVGDERSLKLVEMERAREGTGGRGEALYRLRSECHVDEHLFRMNWQPESKSLQIQLLRKNASFPDMGISREERWALYVDHYVEIGGASYAKGGEPFLKRALSAVSGSTLADSPNMAKEDAMSLDAEAVDDRVQVSSGLELKICLRKYKIHFVAGTEDFFFRPRSTVSRVEGEVRRGSRWKEVVESWADGMERRERMEKEAWMEGIMLGREGMVEVRQGDEGKRYVYLGDEMCAGGDDSDMLE